jgi:hypothetical protein
MGWPLTPPPLPRPEARSGPELDEEGLPVEAYVQALIVDRGAEGALTGMLCGEPQYPSDEGNADYELFIQEIRAKQLEEDEEVAKWAAFNADHWKWREQRKAERNGNTAR